MAQSPGESELLGNEPLIGKSGQLLAECCRVAGFSLENCYKGNVIGFRPPANDFGFFCGKKAEVGVKGYPYPAIGLGQYLKPEWFPELKRLRDELVAFKPNVVVTLGNEALWALCRVTGITKWRGSIMEGTLLPGIKVLPTFHPAAALRAYDMKIIITVDLLKAISESKTSDIERRHREVWLYPSVEDLWKFKEQCCTEGGLLSVDIETKKGFITCIGFAPSDSVALVVPFYSELRPAHNYWRTSGEENMAWKFVSTMLDGRFKLLGQNFTAYDAVFMLFTMGIFPRCFADDTMLQHHAFQLELEKGLGFLSSVFCNEPSYKQMRPRGTKPDKRDE